MAQPRYADPDYWDRRYSRHSAPFDWFYGFDDLKQLLKLAVPKDKLCLHVGCGNSSLQQGMCERGWTVVNTDISSVVIEQMRAAHAHMKGLIYLISDCRNMPEFTDHQFGSVIDKGTVDALVCCKEADTNLDSMFSEISRVLQPGGVFLLISLGEPSKRLGLLTKQEYGWAVTVCLLPKSEEQQEQQQQQMPAPQPLQQQQSQPVQVPPQPLPQSPPAQHQQPASPLVGQSSRTPQIRSPASTPGGRHAVSYLGPLRVSDDNTVVGMPDKFDPSSYIYAYICKRHKLTLPQRGERRKLPPSWRAATKEMAVRLQQQLGLPEHVLLSRAQRRSMRMRRTSAYTTGPAADDTAEPAAASNGLGNGPAKGDAHNGATDDGNGGTTARDPDDTRLLERVASEQGAVQPRLRSAKSAPPQWLSDLQLDQISTPIPDSPHRSSDDLCHHSSNNCIALAAGDMSHQPAAVTTPHGGHFKLGNSELDMASLTLDPHRSAAAGDATADPGAGAAGPSDSATDC